MVLRMTLTIVTNKRLSTVINFSGAEGRFIFFSVEMAEEPQDVISDRHCTIYTDVKKFVDRKGTLTTPTAAVVTDYLLDLFDPREINSMLGCGELRSPNGQENDFFYFAYIHAMNKKTKQRHEFALVSNTPLDWPSVFRKLNLDEAFLYQAKPAAKKAQSQTAESVTNTTTEHTSTTEIEFAQFLSYYVERMRFQSASIVEPLIEPVD